ncbi:hypothetical protein GCM10023096_80830 [Nonomuraea ferruginea]
MLSSRRAALMLLTPSREQNCSPFVRVVLLAPFAWTALVALFARTALLAAFRVGRR